MWRQRSLEDFGESTPEEAGGALVLWIGAPAQRGVDAFAVAVVGFLRREKVHFSAGDASFFVVDKNDGTIGGDGFDDADVGPAVIDEAAVAIDVVSSVPEDEVTDLGYLSFVEAFGTVGELGDDADPVEVFLVDEELDAEMCVDKRDKAGAVVAKTLSAKDEGRGFGDVFLGDVDDPEAQLEELGVGGVMKEGHRRRLSECFGGDEQAQGSEGEDGAGQGQGMLRRRELLGPWARRWAFLGEGRVRRWVLVGKGIGARWRVACVAGVEASSGEEGRRQGDDGAEVGDVGRDVYIHWGQEVWVFGNRSREGREPSDLSASRYHSRSDCTSALVRWMARVFLPFDGVMRRA